MSDDKVDIEFELTESESSGEREADSIRCDWINRFQKKRVSACRPESI